MVYSLLSPLWLSLVVAAPGLPSANPAEVGLAPAKLAELDQAMERFVAENKLAGILTVVARKGKVAHVGIHGMMDREASAPMRRDAIFRIYSMTKPITTAALMALFEEGRFDLDDPVEKYLPQMGKVKVYGGKEGDSVKLVPLERPITIRDLMRHTAGLGYGLRPTDPVETMYREAKLLDRAGNLDTMLDRLVTLPLLAQPGQRWAYSIAVDVQGKLIEKLSGKRLDEFFQQRILGPLEMDDTAFYVPSDKLERFTANYGPKPDGGGLVPIDSPANSPYRTEPTFLSGGGGLVSTADDYLRFAQMMLNGGELDGRRVLKPETVALMTQNQLPEKLVPITLGILPLPRTGFGLGVAVRMSAGPKEPPGSVGEYFWGGAASTQFFVAPKEELVGIIMAQYMPIMQNHYLEFRDKTYAALEGAPAK